MAITTPQGIDLQAPEALELKTIQPNVAARDNISLVTRYIGLKVFVQDTGLNYQLRGGITNANWVQFGDALNYDDFYTKVELQTSGLAEVHWGNLTNVPTEFNPSAHTHVEADITDLQNYLLDVTNEPIGDLNDVNISSPQTNQVLSYSGGVWINTTPDTSSAVWGNISGTISNQLDLQNELNSKKDDFLENSAFNRDFGVSYDDVARGNHTHSHTQLTDIIWTDSEHTGTAGFLAGFDENGDPTEHGLAYDSFSNLPLVGSEELIYVTKDKNGLYYWNGSAYIPINSNVPGGALTNDFTGGSGWDASTNTPTVVSGVGNLGDFAVVSVSGTTNIDGIDSWYEDDYIWWDHSNSVWKKIDNQSTISSSNRVEFVVTTETEFETAYTEINNNYEGGIIRLGSSFSLTKNHAFSHENIVFECDYNRLYFGGSTITVYGNSCFYNNGFFDAYTSGDAASTTAGFIFDPLAQVSTQYNFYNCRFHRFVEVGSRVVFNAASSPFNFSLHLILDKALFSSNGVDISSNTVQINVKTGSSVNYADIIILHNTALDVITQTNRFGFVGTVPNGGLKYIHDGSSTPDNTLTVTALENIIKPRMVRSNSGDSYAAFMPDGTNEYLTVKGTDASLITEFLDASDVQKITISNTGKLNLDVDQQRGLDTGITFGNNTSSFYESFAYILNFTTAGATRFQFSTNYIRAGGGTGPAILNGIGSLYTEPSIVPYYSDIDTGINRGAEDQLSLIAGGIEGLRIDENTTPGIARVWVNPDGTVGSGTGIAFGDGDTIIREDADDSLQILTANTTRVRIFPAGQTSFFCGTNGGAGDSMHWYDSNTLRLMTLTDEGELGIGTTTPAEYIHVYETGSPVILAEGTVNAYLRLKGSNTENSIIDFADSDSDIVGRLIYDHDTDVMRFVVNTAERVRIDSSGNIGIGTISPASKIETFRSDTGVHWTLDRAGVDVASIGASSTYLSINTLSGNIIYFNPDKLDVDTRFDWDTGIALLIEGSSGNVGIGTVSPTALLDIDSDKIRLRTSKTPSSATDTGNQGDIAWDSNYMYVCTATNTWKRTALSTW